MGKTREKLLFLAKHGPEHPEKATLPFAMALGAMATDIDAVVTLQSDAVLLSRTGVADHVFAAGMTPLKELMDLFLADGGTLLVCTACLAARKLEKKHLLKGAVLASVARLANEFTESTNVVTY